MSHCAATIANACLGEMSCQGSVNQRGVSYFQKLLAFGVEPLCSYREKLCFQLTRPLMGLNMTSRVLPAMLLIGLCCLLQPSTSQADPESYADIVEKVMPSVVNISIESAGERVKIDDKGSTPSYATYAVELVGPAPSSTQAASSLRTSTWSITPIRSPSRCRMGAPSLRNCSAKAAETILPC